MTRRAGRALSRAHVSGCAARRPPTSCAARAARVLERARCADPRGRGTPARPACRPARRPPTTPAATSGSGGLEIATITSVPVVGGQQLEAAPDHHPADLGAQVAPADADRVRDPDPRRVEQAADLLRPGARRADDADRPALDRVGEAERDAVDDRRAAVGAHEQQPALERAALERGLLLEATPSEKQNTCRPASSAAAAS